MAKRYIKDADWIVWRTISFNVAQDSCNGEEIIVGGNFNGSDTSDSGILELFKLLEDSGRKKRTNTKSPAKRKQATNTGKFFPNISLAIPPSAGPIMYPIEAANGSSEGKTNLPQ